jgi:DNA-binding IclR family transcriptional regulator
MSKTAAIIPAMSTASTRPAPRRKTPVASAAQPDGPARQRPQEHQSATARSLAILRAISTSAKPVSSLDLSPELGLPKATVHRLMQGLEELGYLEREPGGSRFIAGPQLATLALDAFIHAPQRAVRHRILQSLVDETNETCNITLLAGSEVVYVDRVESHWPLRTHMQPGSRVPLHCGASGKLFLSYMRPQQRHRLLTAAPLRKLTEHTVVDPVRIEAELKRVRSEQLGIDVEEFITGLIGLAVPVFDARQHICATVSLHVPTARRSAQQALEFVPALRRAAAAIGATLA